MTNRENVVGVPNLIWIVAIDDCAHLVGHGCGTAPAMRVTVDGMRAPVAAIGTAASRDQIDTARAVVSLPGVEVQLVIDRLAIRQRQRIEILYLGALACAYHLTTLIAKRDAGNVV